MEQTMRVRVKVNWRQCRRSPRNDSEAATKHRRGVDAT